MWIFFLVGIFALQTLALQSAEDYKIESLPGIDVDKLGFSMHAGLIPVKNSKKSSLFFWRIGSENPSKKTVIWLNGGPGCSSMDGLFLENGPLRMKKDQSIEINSGGWQRFATLIYVDQPVGTGFSPTKNGYLHNMDDLTDEFMSFLDNYSEIFPSIRNQEIYIAGESYAGIYIPYYAIPLLKRIKEDNSNKYDLKGLMIGNGWISPRHQYHAYYDFAMRNNLVKGEFIEKLSDQMNRCEKIMAKKDEIHISACEEVFSVITSASVKKLNDGRKVCVNAYDKRLTNEPYDLCGSDWPQEGAQLQKYLRKPELLKAIHVQGENISWEECDNNVYIGLEKDKSEPSYHLLPSILENIPIMLFSGDQDIICNHIGTEYLIGNMTWNGERGLSSNTKKMVWEVNSKSAGHILEDRGLSYALVKDASHMAPYDKPLEMLALFRQFIIMYDNDSKENMAQMKDNRLSNTKPPAQAQKIKRDIQNTKFTKTEENQWSQHFYWGTGILITMTLFTISLCCCWYYERKRSTQKRMNTYPIQPDDIMMEEKTFKKIKEVFNYRDGQVDRLHLDESNSSNDINVLVNHPSLFEIDDEDDSDVYSETPLNYSKFE